MTKPTPTLLIQVERVERLEATRLQAAEALGISVQNFTSKVLRAGLIDRLKASRNQGGSTRWTSPGGEVKQYGPAVELALRGQKVADIASDFPDLTLRVLYKRVARAKALRDSQKPRNPPVSPADAAQGTSKLK